MGRKIKLNEEQVWMLRNQVFPKTLAEWSSYMDVSVPVLIAAKKMKPPYDFGFTEAFVNEMAAKYFNRR